MLVEIYRTEPIPYRKIGEFDDRTILGVYYKPNKKPYAENLAWFIGLTVQPYPTPDSPHCVYVFAHVAARAWPSYGHAMWRFNGKTGKFISRMYPGTSMFTVLAFKNLITSRLGRMYAIHLYGSSMYEITFGDKAQAFIGDWDEEKKGDSWKYGSVTVDDKFGISGFGAAAIDDTSGRDPATGKERPPLFISGSSLQLRVFEWLSGKFLYSIEMPQNISAVCLEDDQRCYVMLTDQTLVLVDYYRGEIMGAAKLPSLSGVPDGDPWGGIIAWDKVYRRILVTYELPNDPVTGASRSYVRGFRQVPVPVRLTTPIPLKAPRQGRQIPVLVQAVGDMNEGVGGYALTATVQGSGMLMGAPVSDHDGNTLIQVLCSNIDLYGYGYEYDVNLPPDTTLPPLVFTPTAQQIGIGMFDDMEGPAIIGIGESAPNAKAVFLDLRNVAEDYGAALELAEDEDLPLEIYKDGYGLTSAMLPSPSGIRALIYAYPEEDMAVSVSLGLVRDALTQITGSGRPVDLACAAYCQYRAPGNYALTEEKVIAMLHGVWELAIEFNVGAIWLFTKRRISGLKVVDGIDYWPSIAAAVEGMKAASGDWQNFPAGDWP